MVRICDLIYIYIRHHNVLPNVLPNCPVLSRKRLGTTINSIIIINTANTLDVAEDVRKLLQSSKDSCYEAPVHEHDTLINVSRLPTTFQRLTERQQRFSPSDYLHAVPLVQGW